MALNVIVVKKKITLKKINRRNKMKNMGETLIAKMSTNAIMLMDCLDKLDNYRKNGDTIWLDTDAYPISEQELKLKASSLIAEIELSNSILNNFIIDLDWKKENEFILENSLMPDGYSSL